MSGPHHRKLWLWRNFVDGIPEYWAFGNAYPCRLGGGDPLVFGEPCGYALHIESSVGRDYDDDEVLATVMRANAMQHEAELATLRARAERAEAGIVKANSQAEEFERRYYLEKNALEAAQSTIAELTGQVERLRDFVGELADEPCSYGDGCPAFVGTRHGTCLHCQARAALGGAA